jgi:replicative DNA helicase
MALAKVDQKKLAQIMSDPVLWAQAFLRTFDPKTKTIVPWTARWYQVEMLRDKSTKKVYRCGRRIGKTETMVVEMLFQAFANKNFRVLMAAPYENQIRNMFTRLSELIAESPLVKEAVVGNTKNPYKIEFANGSKILGFTTGDDASSIRGQKADWIYIDEIDFMSEYCFEVVAAVAIERSDIGITVSSTPLGKRSHFYRMCTDPNMKYSQHFHPSTHNPNWNAEMEAELRAQLTAEGYVHEVLAEFGTQEKGVFNKTKLDEATKVLDYAYNELDFFQKKKCAEENREPIMYMYNKSDKPPKNIFRTMGVDWDKYQASSSILILDYDMTLGKFKVFKRYELPRAEYSYDVAVKTIIELNDLYNPSWIYCDKGSGEYQVEALHIYGDQHPRSGLKAKVKPWSFANKLDIMDPITKEMDKKPLKSFMVNQLQIAFERDRMVLSPWDNVLLKQLVDYEVEKTTESGIHKYTSENEHFVDALGLAYLAMVLEFKNITGVIEEVKTSSEVKIVRKSLNPEVTADANSRSNLDPRIKSFYENTDFSEREGDRPTWVKVDMDYRSAKHTGARGGWGARSSGGGGGFRRSW